VRFLVLGALEVVDGDRTVKVAGQAQRRLLVALLARRGCAVSVDELTEAVWGGAPPPTAERTLSSHLARLRDTLGRGGGAPLLEHRDSGYRLDTFDADVDVVEFESLLARAAECADHDPALAAASLGAALRLWRGAPFADLLGTAYPSAEAARLGELREAAAERHARCLLVAGDPVAAAAALEGILADRPFREGAWELLILALYRQGRQAEALAAFQRAQTILREELGVDPGQGLLDLHRRVLEHDPALLVAAGSDISGADERHDAFPCPYKGLARYDATDMDLFVGREGLVRELVGRLVDGRLVVLVGMSGAGKSSVVRAGLLPALSAGVLPGSAGWSTVLIVPGRDPAATITEALAAEPDLLVIDQAEEFFTTTGADSVQRKITGRLIEAVDSGMHLVVVVRAEFYGRLADQEAFARRAGPSTILVGPPSEPDLRRIVAEPARRVGLQVDEEVTQTILSEVRGRPGVLPVLSTALLRTWEHREGRRLTMAAYRAGGGVAAGLGRAGEEAWAELDDDEQAAARRILVRLASWEDGAWVGRRARRTEVAPPTEPAAVSALAALERHRLVVAHTDDLEICHEAVLTGWPRLAGWVEESRTAAALLGRLSEAAAAWESEARDAAALYRGSRLQAALEVAAARPDDLTALEREFLQASAAEAERELTDARQRATAAARGRRRTRIVAGVLAAALVTAVLAGTAALRQTSTASHEAAVADARRLSALSAGPVGPDVALLLAVQSRRLSPGPESDGALSAALLRSPALFATARGASGITTLSLSADGKTLLSGGSQGELDEWSTASLAQLHHQRGDLQHPVTLARFARNGLVVVGLHSGASEAVPRETIQVRRSFSGPATGRVSTGWNASRALVELTDQGFLVWVSAGSSLFGVQQVHAVRVSDPGRELPTVALKQPVFAVTACGLAAVCLHGSNGVRVLHLADGSLGPRMVLPRDATEVVGAPDGSSMAVGSESGAVSLWSLPTGRFRSLLRLTGGGASVPLAFSRDGRLLAATDGDHDVLVWDVVSGALRQRFTGHLNQVVAAVWSADGRALYTAGADRQILAWDVAGGRGFGRRTAIGGVPDFHPVWVAGTTMVEVTGDRLRFVDLATGAARISTLSPHQTTVSSVGSGRSGRLLASVDANGVVAIWDVPHRELLREIDLVLAGISPTATTASPEISLSPDDRRVAIVETGLIVVDTATVDAATGSGVRRLTLRPPLADLDHYQAAGWSPDGRTIALTSAGSAVPSVQPGTSMSVVLIDAATGTVRHRFAAAAGKIIAIDPGNRWLAVGGEDQMLHVYSQADGHPLVSGLPAGGPVTGGALTDNGRTVVTATSSGVVRLWDTESFTQLGPDLPRPSGVSGTTGSQVWVDSLGRVVTVFGDGNAWMYPADRAAWEKLACALAGRQLTRSEWRTYLPDRAYQPACG